jgi:hypothetical protein
MLSGLTTRNTGQTQNTVHASNPLGPYVTFAFDLAIFLQDLVLVPINFFVFLINSGVPLSLFGVVIFPGF